MSYCIYPARMSALRQNPPANCSTHCGRCGIASVAVPTPYEDKLRGWRLVWRAGVVFLLPLCGSIIGAGALSESPMGQLVGVAAGFIVAVVLAMLLTRLWRI